MDRWTEVELFVQAAELGSLTRAAEALGISNSAASRYLLALESRLNVRLVQRTTRRLCLTELGEQFYARSKDILSEMKEAEAAVSEHALNPTGTLRISASLSFCLKYLLPLIPEFTRRYPDVTVDVAASNRSYDLIENGVDMAIRTRRIETDSSTTIRRLAETRRLLAASPQYLAKHGTPMTPDDLRRHKLLLYTLADKPNEFHFRKGDESIIVPVQGLLYANDGQIIQAAGRDGLGILAQPAYIIHDDLAAGRLVRVLDDWDLPRLTMNIVFPTRTHMPIKVRLFIAFLVEQFRKHDYETLWMS
ncbi:MAG: LysR family transcriptional regulator [Methylocella sp.]